MGQRAQNADLFEFAACLAEELRIQTDRERRIPLLFALYRCMEENPEKKEDALLLLDEIIRLRPNEGDAIWEAWRTSRRRGPKEQLRALTALKGALEFPKDIIHAHLYSAEIRSAHLGENESALQEINAARKIAPNQRETVLASAWALARADESAADWIEDLEKFALLTADSTVQAALFAEIAELKRATGADPNVVSHLLSRALSLPGLDWTIVASAMRTAEKIEDWQLCETAIEKLAEAASAAEVAPVSDKPFGHSFCGFEQGENEAGAYYWYLAQIRERLLKDPKKALTAVEQAQSYLPRNRLLKLERARLLCAVGRPEDAFAAVPEDAAFCELAVFALAAGKHEEAAYLASLERESALSLFSEVLAESLNEQTAAPPLDAPLSLLQYWFDSHPDHPDAMSVAEALRPFIDPSAVVALFLEENASPDRPIVEVADKRRLEPWSYALNALLGDDATRRADAFANWAHTTTDAVLKSILLRTASMMLENEIGPTPKSHAWMEQALLLNTEIHDDAAAFLPTPENWQAALSALESSPEDAVDTPASAFNRLERALILSNALGDDTAAATLLKSLQQGQQDDMLPSLLLLGIACRIKDFDGVAEQITALISRTKDDAAKMLLSAGELFLLLDRDVNRALSILDAAADANDERAGIAQIYRLLALHLLYEDEAILRALEDSPAESKKEIGSFWDLQEEEGDGLAAAGLLEGKADLKVNSQVSNVLSAVSRASLDPAGMKNAANHLSRLAALLTTEEHADAFRVAAGLLHSKSEDRFSSVRNLDESDALLCHSADKAKGRTGEDALQSLLSQAGKVRSIDVFEWIDWMLFSAEAAAQIYGPANALDLIHEALAVSPEHPGLLEAEVRFANASGEYEEAADTRGRLARFYISQDEKVHQLSQAALILFDKLQDATGARNILNEAKRRNPGHAEANEVLHYILRAVGDLEKTDPFEKNESEASRTEIEKSKQSDIESSEKEIAELVSCCQWDAAMEAVNNLIMRFPERLSIHRTRLDLLTRAKRWEEAVAAAEAYFNEATNKEERRSIVFRAAAIADDVLKDPRLAIAWLLRLQEVGDFYAEAINRIREIATKAGIEKEVEDILTKRQPASESEPEGQA